MSEHDPRFDRPAFTSDAERERFHREVKAAQEAREISSWWMNERARLDALERKHG